MATAPAYQSALIESLRAASPGFGSNNPGVTMLPNPANSSLMINFLRGPRAGLANNPQAFTWPTVASPPPPAPTPAPPPPPVIGPGGPSDPPVIGPGPVVPPVTPLPPWPDDFVGPPAPGIVEVDPPAPPAPEPDDDFVGPPSPNDDFVGPMPDDFVGPPAPDEDVAQPSPVPDPAPPDAVDLPPLPPGGGDDDFVGPMPDDFVGPLPDDFVGPMPDDFVGPMPDDFVGPPEPPEYDEIPEGEIEIGPPGDTSNVRDALDQIGDITEVGDPLDELRDIDPLDPVINPPPLPQDADPDPDFVGPLPDDFVGPPAPDEIPEGEIAVGPPGDTSNVRAALDEIGDITRVADPINELGPIDFLDDFVGPMPYIPSDDDFVGPAAPYVPNDDFVGPPAPDEIPEGEINVVAPGSSQLARDALNELGNITELDDPLAELGDIELSIPENWAEFSAADKIDWYNQNDVGVDELKAAGVTDFEIQWMQQNGYEGVATPTNSLSNANISYLGTPEQEMQLGVFLEPSEWSIIEPDLSVGLPAAVSENSNPYQLTDQDMFEMTLFNLMAQQLLTGPGGSGKPVDEFDMMVER